MLSLVSFFQSSWKYLLAAAIALAVLALVASTELKRAEQNGFDRATAACEQQIQQQQIEVQHETIQTIQKAKIISKNNSALERDQLIDKL